MATIDRIKISQEINFNGLPTWIGLEGILLEGENEKEALRQLQKVITDYHNEEAKAYSQSRWGSKENSKAAISDEIQAALDGINACEELEGEAGLKRWWTKSKNNLILSNAYKAKEKQLTDAK